MADKIVYIGRSAGNYYGKTLYEIVRQVKNFAVGRMVIRESFSNRYPEPSYYIIQKSEPVMSDNTMKHGRIEATKVFRGVRFPEVQVINSGYKPDWALVPKHLEHKYLNFDGPKREMKLIPKQKRYPPVLEKFLMKEGGLSEPPMMVLEPKISTWNIAVREDKTEDEEVIQHFPHGGVTVPESDSSRSANAT